MGGYIQIGKIVIVNIRVKVTAAGNVEIWGFPAPILNVAVAAAKMSANAMLSDFAYMQVSGALFIVQSGTIAANDEIAISATYLSQ